ncbi:hypothetical protein FS749_003243, partial [Ceratobasidium sp. UAMH 11750]
RSSSDSSSSDDSSPSHRRRPSSHKAPPFREHDHCKLRRLFEVILASGPPHCTQGSGFPDVLFLSGNRPRIIYVRDFGISSIWASDLFSTLRTAVYQPPSGENTSSSSLGPIALILGLSPPLLSEKKPSRRPRHRGLFGFSSWFGTPRDDGDSSDSELEQPDTSPWSEGGEIEPQREKRLQKRVKQWKANTLLDNELSPLYLEVGLLGHSSHLPESTSGEHRYLRSCIIMPSSRDVGKERVLRKKRRLELNQLRVQLALAAVDVRIGPISPNTVAESLPNHWTLHIIDSKALSRVVDNVVATASVGQSMNALPSSVSWASVSEAWKAYHDFENNKVAWIEAKIKEDQPPNKNTDVVLERVKKLGLSQHERQMLRSEINTTFDSVHLPIHTIDRIRSLVSLPLLYPEVFQSGILKQHSMSRALLFGPPGTGKTLIARAVAKESGARMIAIKPSDIQDMYVGESEKIVTAVFQLARRLMPCLIFIDEIDALLGARSSQANNSSARYHASLITQFMQEMDGILSSKVVVVGATNRPFDLDDAVLRRLPCRVLVDLPGREARETILRIMLRDEHLAPDVRYEDLASKTEHYSGSDLKHLCVSAVLAAVKDQVDVPWKAGSSSTLDGPRPAHAACPNDVTSQAVTFEIGPQVHTEQSLVGTSTSSVNGSTLPPTVIVTDEVPAGMNTSLLLSGSELVGVGPTPSNANQASYTPDKLEAPGPRMIHRRHFEHALAEVKPSSSEADMSVRELRRWNLKLGAGGSNHQDTPSSPRPGSADSLHPPSSRLGDYTAGTDHDGSQSEAGATSASREFKKTGWNWSKSFKPGSS